MVKLSPDPQTGLTKESVADTFQVRSISHSRFIQKLGQISTIEMQKVANALRIVLTLSLD